MAQSILSSKPDLGPERSCRVCRTKKPKAQLQRWVLVNGELTEDPAQKMVGRGFYSCSEKCAGILPLAIKKRGK